MIVDDEDGPRKSLRIVFKGDYNILLASDGASALELARQNRIDAAVLDICMADMTGIELLGHLKEVDPEIQVVMLTAYETLETARQALRFGACDYLNKPFDISTMRAAVARAMERRTISDEINDNRASLEQLKTEIRQQQLQQEIMRTRGEIYASIIHDINGPLTVIVGFVDMINEQIEHATCVTGEDLTSVRDYLLRINKQVNNCLEIARRYLRFLHERPSESSSTSVNQVLRDLEQLLCIHPASKRHQLICSPLTGEIRVCINCTELIQILLNLSINALQCSPSPHRVEIKGWRLPSSLDVSQDADEPGDGWLNREGLQNTGSLVALSVTDNGPGIPAEILSKIFEPFFTTKPAGQGTGLGLSIVARLVKSANGAVHLRTRVGEGTTFTLYLPVAQE